MSVGPPKDNWNLTYCILFLHGIGVLLPWNMLTTIAQDYYVDLKLSDHDASGNITTQSTYALNFFSYLGIFAQAPNFILNVVNLVLRIKGDLLNRVMAMIIVLFVSVVFTMIWIWIDTDAWKTLFFWMTMVSFIIFNGAGGVYQNSMFGVAAVLPSKFTNAIIFGNNVCGTFIAIINIITIAALSDKPKIAATVYFAVSLAIVLVCFLSVPVLKKLPFYQYYENLSKFPQKDEEDQEEVVLNMATYCVYKMSGDLNQDLSNHLADISIKYVNELYDGKKAVVFSPISLQIALAMAYAGAGGKTEEELGQFLGNGAAVEKIHNKFHVILTELAAPPANEWIKCSLKSANKIYIKDDYEVLDSYKNSLSKFYDGQFESINFNDSENAAKVMNKFVSDATNEKIKDLIAADAINNLTRIILINCLYFKGDWVKKFKPHNTEKDQFYGKENVSREMEFMKRNDFMLYNENDSFQCLTLPFDNQSIKMVIVLPKKRFGLGEVFESVNGSDFLKLVKGSENQGVDISIPKFKIESKFGLNDSLKKMGINDAFVGNVADFSGITMQDRLSISSVVQKVVIDVNEDGCEAAAATGLMMELCCMPMVPEDPIIFKADQPFAFFLIHDDSTVLFNGIYQ
uniref:SERPIN domain-containing protein n=1 Tax=Rhabditophanes sp. KR3021 TaxID=114890 RepID=A0AC35UF02_9BILA